MWRFLSVLSILIVDIGCLVAFSVFDLYKNQKYKNGTGNNIHFLGTDRLYRYLACRPVYLYLISYITMLIIDNKLHSINSYCHLKYGLLIRKLLDITR